MPASQPQGIVKISSASCGWEFVEASLDTPKVFISYSHKDIAVVERIALLLKENGVDVWYDEWKLDVGSSLLREIQTGIRRANFVVLCLSRNSTESSWVWHEYEASFVREIESKGDLKILPVRLDDCEFPVFLSGRVFADFRPSFVYGFTKLLRAILGDQGTNPVERVFYRYSRQLVQFPNTVKNSSIDDILQSLSPILKNRAKSAELSAVSLGNEAGSSIGGVDSGQFREWLGSTVRDYMIFRVFQYCGKFLRNSGTKTLDQDTVIVLIDQLYSNLYNDSLEFGIGKSRSGYEYLARDIEMIFEILLNPVSDPGQEN